MPRTNIRGNQVLDQSIQRDDLDVTTVGQAVVRKIVQGVGISLSSDGADAGTGNVTINTSIKQTEVDFGSIPTSSKVFTITDATVGTSNKILAIQSGDAPTGKSADENEMDQIDFIVGAGTGQFTLYAFAAYGPIVGKYKVNYQIG